MKLSIPIRNLEITFKRKSSVFLKTVKINYQNTLTISAIIHTLTIIQCISLCKFNIKIINLIIIHL